MQLHRCTICALCSTDVVRVRPALHKSLFSSAGSVLWFCDSSCIDVLSLHGELHKLQFICILASRVLKLKQCTISSNFTLAVIIAVHARGTAWYNISIAVHKQSSFTWTAKFVLRTQYYCAAYSINRSTYAVLRHINCNSCSAKYIYSAILLVKLLREYVGIAILPLFKGRFGKK